MTRIWSASRARRSPSRRSAAAPGNGRPGDGSPGTGRRGEEVVVVVLAGGQRHLALLPVRAGARRRSGPWWRGRLAGTLGGGCLRRGGPAADGVAPSQAWRGRERVGRLRLPSRDRQARRWVRPMPATPSTAATIHAVPLPPSPPSGVAATRRDLPACVGVGVGVGVRRGVARLRRRRRIEGELLPQVLLRRRGSDGDERPGQEEGDEPGAGRAVARGSGAAAPVPDGTKDLVRARPSAGSSPASPPA